MSAKPKKIPGPDHPITVEPSRAHVIVRVANIEIANSAHAPEATPQCHRVVNGCSCNSQMVNSEKRSSR